MSLVTKKRHVSCFLNPLCFLMGRVRHPCRVGETTGLSTSRKWTAWLRTETRKYKSMDKDSNKQHGGLPKDDMDVAHKQAASRYGFVRVN